MTAWPILTSANEERPKLLLENVCRANGLVDLKEPIALFASVRIEVFWVAKNQVAMAFDELPALLAGHPALRPDHLINRLVDVQHQVETVIYDMGPWEAVLRGVLVGTGTANANNLYPFPLFFGKLHEERLDAFLICPPSAYEAVRQFLR